MNIIEGLCRAQFHRQVAKNVMLKMGEISQAHNAKPAIDYLARDMFALRSFGQRSSALSLRLEHDYF